MRCRGCDYDLRALCECRCPECGQPFDPLDVTTFRSEEEAGRDLAAIPRMAAMVCAAYPVLWVGLLYFSWFLGWLHVGRWPRPGWEQAKGLGPPFVALRDLSLSLVPVGLGVAVLSMACALIAIALSIDAREKAFRSGLAFMCCAALWSAAYLFVCADPHRVLCWLWD